MKIDRLIPNELTKNVDDRHRARLTILAILVAQTATLLVCVLLHVTNNPTTASLLFFSCFIYLGIIALMHATRSAVVASHSFVIMLFLIQTYDFGTDNGYGIIAGIALPIAAAALIGYRGAIVWTIIAVAWQAYLAPLVFRVGDFTLEWGFSAAVMSIAIGIASAVVEYLREQSAHEVQQQRAEIEMFSERVRMFASTTFPARMEVMGNQIYAINDGFDELLGYPSSTIPHRKLRDFIHPDDLHVLHTQLKLDRPQGVRQEMRMRHANGSWTWIETFGIQLPRESNQSAWVFIARDAHDEVLSRDRLLQAKKLESVGTLAAGLAHDFNNLLMVIVGHASLLPEGEDREQILEASDRATHLIQALRVFSRTPEPANSAIDVAAVIRSITAMSERILGPRISLETTIDTELAWARIDEGALNQVLLNLINNAKDAIEDTGQIKIHLYLNERDNNDADECTITVSDNGCGMDETTRSRAFEPFYTTKPMHSASGLGLASAYGIVQRAGGELVLNSAPGQGTAAQLTLPLAEPDHITVELDLDASSQQNYAGMTCLLVEDDTSVRLVLRRCLKSLGMSLVEASSADVALALYEAHQPDLVVSDIVMPGMRGSELAQRLRQLRWDLPILLVSGYDQDERIQALSSDPLIKFLAKPIGVHDLERQLESILTAREEKQRSSKIAHI